jgi:hypothetical protein
MNRLRITSWCTLTALVAVGSTLGWNHRAAAQQAAAVDPNGMEVLTRGPVHEAFAETIAFDPEPGIVVAKAPPEPIDEIAPDQRPEGANVTWIPGYWSWDDERNDFLWVSGIWRALPPGRQWVPGYWGQSQQGVQWTSGYWADAAARETDYLPEPPASVETGPNIAAPAEDATWLPGCWIWQHNRYGWRAGYWTKGNQDWDWVPDHYVWTPSGYVFVDGYYDYTVPRRGVVFAPVYFNQGIRSQRSFAYSPSTVINPGVFARNLFLRPSYGHYYFGDYYGSNYANSGYSPWFSYQSNRRGYDPIYAHQRWQHRQDRDWQQRNESNFRDFSNNENARPPRNWATQRSLAGRGDANNRRDFAVAAPYNEFTQQRDGQLRFQSVNPSERQQFGQRRQQYRQYLQQRQQLEANAAVTTGVVPTTTVGPNRRRLSTSPFVAQSADQLGTGYAPPQRHQTLKPDFQLQPQPRNRRGNPGMQTGFGPGTGGSQQIGAQGQPQQQDLNRRNRRSAAPGQSPGQGANMGTSGQGFGTGQAQGQPQGQSQGAPSVQASSGSGGQTQGGSGTSGQQQAATGGQEQASPPIPVAPSE